VAIILTTLALKLLLIPFSKQQIVAQKRMQELQPQIKEIQQKHKNDKEKQTKELMAFYKENKANPLSGCLPLILQLVFLIAIYRVIINISNAGFIVNPSDLYNFIADPSPINNLFLRLVDMTKPNYVLAFLSAATQYYQTKMLFPSRSTAKNQETASSEPDFATIMNKQMIYMGPALTFFIGATFPAALALYWLFSTLFMILQQLLIFKPKQEK
jgi:YidC/Oxa1 family membrane protein insertase